MSRTLHTSFPYFSLSFHCSPESCVVSSSSSVFGLPCLVSHHVNPSPAPLGKSPVAAAAFVEESTSWGPNRGRIHLALAGYRLSLGKQSSDPVSSFPAAAASATRPFPATAAEARGGWGGVLLPFPSWNILSRLFEVVRLPACFILCLSSLQAVLVNNITTGERLIRTLQGEFSSPP